MTEAEQVAAGATSDKQLRMIAIGCLLAGLLVGLLALAGPVAIWLGLADFRLGFKLLQLAYGAAIWIAGITALGAVLVFVLARRRQLAAAGSLGGLALVGAVAAALVWYLPQTYRPPEGTPVIHDIATDPYSPLSFVAIAPLRADAPNNMEYGVMEGVDTVQEHIDLQHAAYPDIVPQELVGPVDEVYARTLAAVERLGWEVVAADAAAGRIEATDTTFWFRFKDDVVITVSENDAGGTVLQARSTSRVGRGDVGKNAARLRELFALVREGD